MSYFNVFPLTYQRDGSIGINITARTKIIEATDPSAYYEYSIVDGDTPEVIADKFYDDPQLSWTILLYNNIINIYKEWPLDQWSLEEYIDKKYPDPYAVHHYESIASGLIVDESHVAYDRYPVTCSEYEIAENDSKRNIKLIIPDLISSIVSQHKTLMSS